MTSAILPPPAPPPTTAPQQQQQPESSAPAPPRKRRRRTAAGGATDDCFTCRSRAVSCDRKRPYCTQCIEIGKECSGYKTTLTWGVGVASRGKLRGLSCPVANKNVDGSDVGPEDLESKKRRKSSVSSKVRSGSVIKSEVSSEPVGIATTAAASSSILPTPIHAHSYPPRISLAIPQLHAWQNPGFFAHGEDENGRQPRQLHRPLQLQTSLGPHFDGTNIPPHSARSVTSYADTEFHSPLDYPHTPSSLPAYAEHLAPSHLAHSYSSDAISTSPADTYHLPTPTVPTPTIGSYTSTMTSGMLEPVTSNASFPEQPTSYDDCYDVLYTPDDPIFAPFTDTQLALSPLTASALPPGDDDFETDHKDFSLLDTRFSAPFFHLPLRLQTFLDYYDRYICPHLVAYDGPENPYRTHVLQLASHHDGLQNAIAALSMNNVRMRRKGRRETGANPLEDFAHAFDTTADFNEPSAEETCYKQMSIDKLNQQLSEAGAAQDDSVLATLLILCLFHVCDSGFSKFKTQLAGVQKLLSLRKSHTPVSSPPSPFLRCIELFFTWFDVLTSTVNNRESQVSRQSLARLDLSLLEQYSGCNARLFPLLARLGRLNLLAQNRQVHNPPTTTTNIPHHSSSSSSTHQPSISRKTVARIVRAMRKKERSAKLRASADTPHHLLTAEYYDNVDGNGWGSPIISSSDDDDNNNDNDPTHENNPTNAAAALTSDPLAFDPLDDISTHPPDDRVAFWREWRNLRAKLRTCCHHPADPSNPNSDISHINAAFRYSALLYTLRLGHPLAQSNWPPIQNLVSEILASVDALSPISNPSANSSASGMRKFTLWPLFMAGTECTDPLQRTQIRHRCIELQRASGFFNNLSSLEVLERVWREADANFGPVAVAVASGTALAPASLKGGDGVDGSNFLPFQIPATTTTAAAAPVEESMEVQARMRDSESGRDGRGTKCYGFAFRWRGAMDRVDGEYIVI